MRLLVTTSEISDLQQEVMQFVDVWAKYKRTPIPRKMIILAMSARGIKVPTTILAINVLLRKGYMRRAIGMSNFGRYVQLRRV